MNMIGDGMYASLVIISSCSDAISLPIESVSQQRYPSFHAHMKLRVVSIFQNQPCISLSMSVVTSPNYQLHISCFQD